MDERRGQASDALRALLAAAPPVLLDSDAVLIGLVGRGIQGSRSPAMHEREGARLGIPYRYVRIDLDPLGLPDAAIGSVVHAATELGFGGLNITHPFKQTVIKALDALSPEAGRIGAVNTVVIKEGQSVGHNTDGWGFAESLRQVEPSPVLRRVVQFGAGGAGAAVAHALLELGVEELRIVDVSMMRADALAEQVRSHSKAVVHAFRDAGGAIPGAEGIVNATPVGMAGHAGTPFPVSLLSSSQWVADIIYFPEETELLRAAKAAGCQTISGSGMAVYQAARAFELFTGIKPSLAHMRAAFDESSKEHARFDSDLISQIQ